jgi:hypothetical protein
MVSNVDPNEWNEKCLTWERKSWEEYMGQHTKVVPRE